MIFALVVLPLALLVFGLPIFIVLLLSSVVMLAFWMNIPMTAVHQNLFAAITSSGMLAVPYFILAGELMSRGTVARRLVGFVQGFVGGLPGALGLTTVGTATVFGAISGSSAAAVASVGKVMHPAMRGDGYPERFSAGMITSVSAIGIIIPPSIPMIVYGAASETSIPRLYAAGVLPGLLLAVLLAAFILWRAARTGLGTRVKVSAAGIARGTLAALPALFAPVIILGGIYGGVFSPTEAASVACLYAIVVSTLVLRELTWRDVLDCAVSTVIFSAQILLIVAAAALFSWLLTVNQVPQAMVAAITAWEVTPWQFLIAINLLLLICGCVMDPMSAILLLVPVLVPIVDALGINKVHFGIVMTLNLAIGLFTPPFGINIFVAQSALGMQTADIYRGIVPFLAVFLVALALITFVPQIALSSMHLLMATP